MMRIPFFKKAAPAKSAPKWSDLPQSKKVEMTKKIVNALGGPRYKLVSGWD